MNIQNDSTSGTAEEDDDCFCPICKEIVGWDHRGIMCDKCQEWYHASCQHISHSDYEELSKEEDKEWFCDTCEGKKKKEEAVRTSNLEKLEETRRKQREKMIEEEATNKRVKEKDVSRMERGNTRKRRLFKVATLNCRGLKSSDKHDTKMSHIAEDMRLYDIDILNLQETHMNTDEPEYIKTLDGKARYIVYHSSFQTMPSGAAVRTGVAIAVREDIKASFTSVSDRVCILKAKLENNLSITIINGYAPTQPVSEEKPELRAKFYEELDSVMRTINNKEYVIIAGDFNAKTGKAEGYHQVLGRYGKGECNTNGIELLEFCCRHGLILTNTMFKHKMSHRTTWESPAHNSESNRKNPIRNQIDYIMVRIQNRATIVNSRSHAGIMTHTDHRLVRMKVNIRRPSNVKNHQKSKRIDWSQLTEPGTRLEYAKKVEEHMKRSVTDNKEEEETRMNSAQHTWNLIVEANREVAGKILGNSKQRKHGNERIKALSTQQKELYIKINETESTTLKAELKTFRNKVIKELHIEVAREKEREIEREIEPIISKKNDSNRMFAAMRELKKKGKKTPIIVETEAGNGTTADTEKKLSIITSFFREMFNSADSKEIEDVEPTPMNKPFTAEEIKKAADSMKNGKSPGIDNIKAEQIKFGPKLALQQIADMFNHIAATGDTPKEMTSGILVPLQKPGKKRGPPSNLRPVILLSVLRKLMAICLIRRIGEKIDEKIPPSQAAYRPGRGTTEQLLTMKLLAEKATTTPNYEIHLLLMDMSKAFDRVERRTLVEDLREVLDKDELHLVKIMLKDVKLAIRIDEKIGEEFNTNIGTPQGDCLSPILFTLYLANALKGKVSEHDAEEERNTEDTVGERCREENRSKEEEYQTLPSHLKDHNYSNLKMIGTMIPLQYADDICWLGANNSYIIEKIKSTIPDTLERRNLIINETKTEEYKISKGGEDGWKSCKYLGTYIDTERDIKSRKMKAHIAMRKIHPIIKHRRIGDKTKIKAFNAYIASIFLYNSETWTITKKTEASIDSFHRRLLREAQNIKWPRKISNTDLYERTGERRWSDVIRERRLRLFGHIMRLSTETPVQKALYEYERPLKKSRGAKKTTWGKNIIQDLRRGDTSIEEGTNIAKDRKAWKVLVKRIIVT